jgi:hypothetical protein
MMCMRKRQEKPKTGSGRLKDGLIQVRCDAAEKQAFEDAANLAGLGLSGWVRERLRWAALKELQEAKQEVAFLAKKERPSE